MMGGLVHPNAMTNEELVFRTTDALRRRRLDGWNLGFAKSIAGRAKHRNWSPSPKQIAVMRRLIAELRAPDIDFAGEPDLLDDGDGGGP